MRELTLEELSPYLAYGLKIYTDKTGLTREMSIYTDNSSCIPLSYVLLSDKHKPILHPMSDIDKRIPYSMPPTTLRQELQEAWNKVRGFAILRNELDRYIKNVPIMMWDYYLVKVLYKYHFDVGNYIKDGLAIDRNTITN